MILLPLSVSPMLVSPLMKVPLLFTATRLTTWAMTPPTPPPTNEERRGYGDKEDPMRPLLQRSGVVYKVRRGIYWANAILESAVILAEHFSSPVSDTILSFLIRDTMRPTHNIRFTRAWVAGCVLMHCGALIRLACYRTLGRLFTWELTLKKGHVLMTGGPYSIVRHPSYTGSLLLGTGVALCHFSPGSWYAECIGWDTWASRIFSAAWIAWSLAVPALLMARVDTEDDVLRKEFGEEWDEYAKKTPYRLIPYLY